ncbi:MAG TPA: hypothetical protein VIZ18_04710, partial [Ktedonobacteraceae bacterium]
DEILPPYYSQTLLQAEDPRYTPVDDAFARKTSAQVFRALKLRRRLFPRRRSPLGAIGETLHDIMKSKSFVAWAAALMLIMMLTAAFTAPSFEQGVSLLLHGSRNGVLKVHNAPQNIHHNTPDSMYNIRSYNPRPTQAPLFTAERMLSFPIYWPQWIPANYTLDSIKIYVNANDTWADGPIVDLVYDIDATHSAPKGTGQIVVREFNPLVQVLQVVQDGYASPINADQYGENPEAIYVDGQWVLTGKMSPRVWKHGGRSEIIYQRDNVVFWIAGDQRDGINQQALWKMVQSLQNTSPVTSALLKNVKATIYLPTSIDATYDPFGNDIMYIASADGSTGQYYMTMSAYALSGQLALAHRH